jgi:hypothetical protein
MRTCVRRKPIPSGTGLGEAIHFFRNRILIYAKHTLIWHPFCSSNDTGGFLGGDRPMASNFKRGDHVEWNSEAGRVRGTIQKKVTSEIAFKGYKHHATKEEPQYIIKSDKTNHVAIHKGSALKKIKG